MSKVCRRPVKATTLTKTKASSEVIQMSQGSLNDDSPVDAADEQLVAYLDGELPQEDVRSVELRLANDPVYRRRLRDLQNGWEMLDELPLPSSSAMLLETTLRMAAVDGGQTSSAGKSKSILKSISKFAWTALLVLGCFGLGMFAVGVRNYLSYQRQLRDLPTAMHIDAYLHANDVAFMKLLQEMPEWQQATKIASRLGVWNFDLIEEVQSVKPKQRETLLHSLPMESQESIRAAWERFENMSADRKQVIEDSAEIVASQPDSDQLLQTMDQFAAWRQTLPIEQRDQLENGTAEQRKSVVRKALEDTTRQWTREQGRALTDDEIETITRPFASWGVRASKPPKKCLTQGPSPFLIRLDLKNNSSILSSRRLFCGDFLIQSMMDLDAERANLDLHHSDPLLRLLVHRGLLVHWARSATFLHSLFFETSRNRFVDHSGTMSFTFWSRIFPKTYRC